MCFLQDANERKQCQRRRTERRVMEEGGRTYSDVSANVQCALAASQLVRLRGSFRHNLHLRRPSDLNAPINKQHLPIRPLQNSNDVTPVDRARFGRDRPPFRARFGRVEGEFEA